ncbi:MAG TPA: MmgE/PrpD family protein [Eoetvoesiella sp.]
MSADKLSTQPLVEKLGLLASNIHYQEMPYEDVQAIKRLILDTLGCAVGAVGCEPAAMLETMLRPSASSEDVAIVIGSGRKTSLESAVLVNGALVRYLDFMDVYWSRDVCHPSENIPLALACAEAANQGGRRLIEAVAVGYEAQLRLADAFSFQDMGMHHVSAAGFVAPLVIGKVWNLSAPLMAHASALGGFRHMTLAALLSGRLSMAKAVGYALPASEAVFSTRLAMQGFTGPLEALEGLWTSSGDKTAESLAEVLSLKPGTGQARRVSFKRFPVQYTLQSPVEAALDLRARLQGDVSAIKKIEIEVHALTCKRTADPTKYRPENRETADHSMPCCVALALLDGKLDTDQFEQGRWADEDVRALMGRIQVLASDELEREYPNGRPVRFTAHMDSGAIHRQFIPIPIGDVDRPMSDSDIEDKFYSLSEPVLGAGQSSAVIELVRTLEQLEDVHDLTSLLVADVSRRRI